MSEDRIKAVCHSLGYAEPEVQLVSKEGVFHSIVARAPSGGQVLLRWLEASSREAGDAFDTRRWDAGSYSTAYVTARQVASAARDPGRDEQTLRAMQLRWELGVMAGSLLVNPILDFGRTSRFLFEVRPYYPATLHHLIERGVNPSSPVLFRLVDQVWTALGFLHQSAVNVPHGAVTAHNIGFDSTRLLEAEARLLDLRETAETRRAEVKRQDFQCLGMLIYQFASGLARAVDAADAALRCPNADWSHLGGQQDAWKNLTRKLLLPDAFPFGFDLAGAKDELLAELRPNRSATLAKIPAPLPVAAEPPFRAPEVGGETTGPQVDYPGEMSRLLEAPDPFGAMRLLLTVPGDYEPPEQVLQWADAIADAADSVAGDAGADSGFLVGLETMATRGSLRCALRLGVWLAKSQPAEALPWLGAASDAGLAESYPVIAEIYERGGEGVEADPQLALSFYQAAVDKAAEGDWETGYRMAALILREREKALAEHLPLAVTTLQRCHDGGHFKATDLLAQCIAQGVGGMAVDEKRAFNLFAEAWNRSKRVNQHYHTASNNLGVCFALGFGVRKDPTMARHYFKQGELAGHEASKKNLMALAQVS